MGKFPCLLFVLKWSYMLLCNLHDCIFNVLKGVWDLDNIFKALWNGVEKIGYN